VSLCQRSRPAFAVTAADVDESRPIADPFHLFHCCPNSDGAAAILLCSEDFVEAAVCVGDASGGALAGERDAVDAGSGDTVRRWQSLTRIADLVDPAREP